MTASDWIALVSLITVTLGGGFGGAFALWQWHNGNKIKRAEFINQIIEKLRFDSELPKIIYMLDYSQKWYDENFHGGSETEMKIDKLFSYLTYICYLSENNMISKKEFCILEYEIRRVCQSRQTQSYLWNLYHFSLKTQTQCSFHNLILYMRNQVFSEDERIKFENKNPSENGYAKRLNF